MIQDIAAELYEFPGTNAGELAYNLAGIENELFRELDKMLRTEQRVAVRLVRQQFYDPRVGQVHHRRIEVDEIEEVFRPQYRMIVPEIDEPFTRNRPTERKPSRLTGRVPPPLFPKPEPLPPKVRKRRRKRKPAPTPAPKPWYAELGQFVRETWDETGKITGCKL